RLSIRMQGGAFVVFNPMSLYKGQNYDRPF
ncbi:unnamed protein product, partial [marine sediment metagenome]